MKKYIILIPIYNDSDSASQLIKNIDFEITNQECEVSILLVNDASNETIEFNNLNLVNIKSVQILHLLKNGGHCHAIATGLKYIYSHIEFDYIIPMDGDGEDRPEELKNFFNLTKNSNPEIITANRVKRSEGMIFKTLYKIHKILTYVIAGQMIKFGNYSCLSKKATKQIISDGSIWLSYSGSVTKNSLSLQTVSFFDSFRGSRYSGPSKMSFMNLVKHSLNISAVFKEVVFIRSSILVMIFSLFAYFFSPYFLILAATTWIFILFIFFLARNDDIKKLNNSENNIKELTTIYSR